MHRVCWALTEVIIGRLRRPRLYRRPRTLERVFGRTNPSDLMGDGNFLGVWMYNCAQVGIADTLKETMSDAPVSQPFVR